MIRRQGTAAMDLDAGPASGKRVLEALGITKRYGDTVVVQPFDLRVERGARVAVVGPNGAGKTTLVNMLIGREAPDAGSVTPGSNLEVAVFDQTRSALNPDATLWDSLTLDPEMAVSGASDQVMVRGTPRHVIGYLKDFLFDERQARAPVRSLSGGEKARLLLARLMARPSNLLVLDEPTNDLDVETLDLLQDVLAEYSGTVLLVSHDRDFLDRVATRTIVMEGGGRAIAYAGGWSDMLAQRGASPVGETADGAADETTAGRSARPSASAAQPDPPRASSRKLSFKQSHRLERLPAEIARREAEIAKLEDLLSDPDLYAREPVKFAKATEALSHRRSALAAAEEEWLALMEIAEAS